MAAFHHPLPPDRAVEHEIEKLQRGSEGTYALVMPAKQRQRLVLSKVGEGSAVVEHRPEEIQMRLPSY